MSTRNAHGPFLAWFALVSGIACSNGTAPLDASVVVFGRITSTSGSIVPHATAIVELFPDTVRTMYGTIQCGGAPSPLGVAFQQLDSAGNYRLEIGANGAGRRVCIEVTGDPHGLYSDVGLKRAYVGWLELRAVGSGAPRDSLRADLKYTEMP